MTKKSKKHKNKEPIIEYSLKDIQIKNFTLLDIEHLEIKEDNFVIDINLSGKINEENNVAQVVVGINISIKLNGDLEKIGGLKIEYYFQLTGVENLKEDGNTYLPKNLINTFNAISISTSRGILFAKFQGTKIQKIILPLIDMKKLEEESVQS
jgi:hypothetical protein